MVPLEEPGRAEGQGIELSPASPPSLQQAPESGQRLPSTLLTASGSPSWVLGGASPPCLWPKVFPLPTLLGELLYGVKGAWQESAKPTRALFLALSSELEADTRKISSSTE